MNTALPKRPAPKIAVIGAGPVGLALALHAATALPEAGITLFDAQPADRDVSGDPRTLALSLGSVQLLQRLHAWNADVAQPIVEVHVSQQPPSLAGMLTAWLGEPEVRIRAIDEAVTMLGAVLRYGQVVAPLQATWEQAVRAAPQRLFSRFATPVAALKNVASPRLSVEVDAGIVDAFDLVVVAEGGVFITPPRDGVAVHLRRADVWRRDYRQTAWVGTVTLENARPGVAYERFTRQGPAALLPLKGGQAALVWCVASDDDPVAELDPAQRMAVLNTIFASEVGRIVALSPMKSFPLGLQVQRTLVDQRIVRIGNAAQTLHPVAGQGLNLGLRDAYTLVRALQRSRTGELDAVLRSLEWQRGPDRWSLIAATDFLARSFIWRMPGAGAARGLGLAALQAMSPIRSRLARGMMFGRR